MKKIFMIIISVFLALSLSACGGSRTSETPAVWNESSGETEETGSQEGTDLLSDTEYSVEELAIDREDMEIYGKLYLPSGSQEPPLVILSHGFGGSYRNTEGYAEYFAANGIAAYAFDFIGGGSSSRSGGSTTEMSVLTEAADLGAVLDHFKADPRFDPEEIFLLGESQGGFVSTYVAGTRPEDIAGLVALYPAYVLQDNSRVSNPDPQNGPETSSLMGVRIGRIYDVDAQSFDIYEIMASYSGKVLIIHGTSDNIAPISYSERAAETFPDAQLVKIEGAGHGFYGDAADQASWMAASFILNEDDESSAAEKSENSSQEGTGLAAQQGLKLKIGDREITVEWEENESVEALRELAGSEPLTISMSMYGGFEQVGLIGKSLPRNDRQTTTGAGDIVLYSGDQIVIFYGSNSWAYTRLGKIQGLSDQEIVDLLGRGNVTITISD